ncbi:MAG: phosphate ABC transporter permease PstA [Methylobacterium sp.]
MDARNPILTTAPAGALPPRANRVRPGRRVADRILIVASTLATLVGIVVLGSILLMLIVEGLKGFSPLIFTQPTPGPGSEGGGIANAILGSLVLTVIGIVVATPVGVMAGTYLAEYGRNSRLADLIRFLNDILLSAPSILIGLFVYTLMVRPMGTYSGWAGGVALAIIATPVIVRTTEDMLRLVPSQMREAGVALGAPPSHVIRSVTWRAASAGIVTGILLALARIAGETAPLLFTALNNNSWFNANLLGGIPNLPVMIYQFALSPYQNWQGLAWAGALLITIAILALSVVARLVVKDQRAR